ncbi:MAG: ABC transporter ATP-binding protein [bacterium]
MNDTPNAIEVEQLVHKYRTADAVNGLSLTVRAGRCYGLFGPNGAGKTTTIRCLLSLLRPTSGTVRIFGMDPEKEEVAVKSRVGYVPEVSAFYPWMTARGVLDYTASFYQTWSQEIELDLLKSLDLDQKTKVSAMSKGTKTKLSLICAIAPQPNLLLLDEPTGGLDPIVRRELIQTVIGMYQDRDPENHTIFVATHMLHEFEGLVDEFTILNEGQELLTLKTEEARTCYKKIRMRFEGNPPDFQEDGIIRVTRDGREMEILTSDFSEQLMARLKSLSPEDIQTENLPLEELFIGVVQKGGKK